MGGNIPQKLSKDYIYTTPTQNSFEWCVRYINIEGLLSWLFSGGYLKLLGYALLTPFLLYGVFTCRKSGWVTR